ncbi:MAG: hypothetical protein P4L73_19115 [Caulobacteraceae bacterium]|nr:hypothetical protein [Caulobacteraceae bacterium]
MAEQAEPITRPKLARWLFERGLKRRDAAAPLGVTPQAVGRYIRPFGDPLRQVPGLEVMERVVAWTGGEIRPADFYPPELSAAPSGGAADERRSPAQAEPVHGEPGSRPDAETQP